MDIAASSIDIKTASLKMDVVTQVTKQAMDLAKANMEGNLAILESAKIERSINPNIGGNIDIRI